jgi:hypothetical protein
MKHQLIRSSGGEMKHVLIVVALMAALGLPASLIAQTSAPKPGASLGSVTLRTPVMADGQRLAAGTYQVRLTSDAPKPGVGQSPDAERYVEFLRGGKVVGREVASVVSQADIGQVADGPRPAAGGARVELLKGDDYVRVWINRGGMNYIIHLPPTKG